jgi:hypothetical protein
MKTTIACILCAFSVILAGPVNSRAASAPEPYRPPPRPPQPSPIVKAADIAFVRPIAFTSTIVGSVLFALSLPVTALTKETHAAREALVIKPAKATFKRPLGDMDALAD